MTFLAPDTLWLLTVVVLAAVVPIAAAVRRGRIERRLASDDARPWVVPHHPGARRVTVAVGACAFLVLVVLASARPARSIDLRRGVTTVVVAFDTSRSMGTDDVPPTRMKAARAAIDSTASDVLLTGRAEGFISGVPDLDQMIARLTAYSEAGADVLYAPGIKTREQIEAVVRAVAPKPVNFLNGAALGHTVADLAAIIVRQFGDEGSFQRQRFGHVVIARSWRRATGADGSPAF